MSMHETGTLLSFLPQPLHDNVLHWEKPLLYIHISLRGLCPQSSRHGLGV